MKLGFKTFVINILVTSLLLPSLVYAQAFSSDCQDSLTNMSRQAASRIVDLELTTATADEKMTQARSIQSDFGRALANLQERQIAAKYFERIKDLQEDLSDLEKCRAATDCVLQRLQITGLKLRRAEETIYESWRAEGRAKKLLRQQVDSVVNAMADATIAQSLGDTAQEGDLKDQLIKRVNDTLSRQTKSPDSLLKRIGTLYIQTIKSSIERKNIRTRPEVRSNLHRGLSIALLNQLAAQILTSFHSPVGFTHQFGSDFWVFLNTITMMNIQAEIGGGKTPFIDKPFSDYEGAMRAIPDFVYGKNGAVTDFKDRFKSFFFIANLEFPVALLLRTASLLAIAHGVTASALATLVVGTVSALPSIYTYLSAKISAFDNTVFLNGFANFHHGTEQAFENALYETLKKDGSLAPSTTLDQFTDTLQHNYWAYKAYFENQLSLKYDPQLAKAYNKVKWVTRSEMLLREANSLWDAVMIFMIIHGANAVFTGSVGMAQEFIKHIR